MSKLSTLKIMMTAILCLFSCGNQKSNGDGTMTESAWRETIPQGHIVIDAMFNPTMELTETIKNTTLQELIIHRYDSIMYHAIKHQTGIENLYPPTQAFAYRAEVHLKTIPAASNLAKVYFLQDFNSFYELNFQFYCAVIDSIQAIRRKERESQAQENWDKYR